MSEPDSEFIMVRNASATLWETPAAGYRLAPGPNLLRRAAWMALLAAKQEWNGLPYLCAVHLRERLADGTLVAEPVDAEISASLGKHSREAATKLVGETFRPSMLVRWLAAERRAAIREAIGRRLCDLLGYRFSADSVSAATDIATRERDEYLLGMASGGRLQGLCAAAGLAEWRPPAPGPRDPFAPVL